MSAAQTLQTYQTIVWDWLLENILTFDMALEAVVVASSLVTAFGLSTALRPRMMTALSQAKLPPKSKLFVAKLGNLLLPFSAAVILFIADQISTALGYDAGLCRIIVKLLMAWIFIRLVTQIISNNFVRNAFAIVIWIIAALSIFGVLEQVSATLGEAGLTLGKFQITALGIIKGVLALGAMLYGSLALAAIVDTWLLKTALNPASRVLIGKITRIFLIAMALLIAITTAGIDLSVLAVFSGALGLGLGFGLQRGFSNMFSGLMLLMDQSIKPGDVIEITDPTGGQTTFGWVTHMGGRHTEIITRDNKSYLIPNEQLITQQVVNWSHGNTLVRLMVSFRVHYNSDPHAVKRISTDAVTKVERVEEDPKPMCHVVDFGDNGIEFSLRFWIRDAEKGVTNIKGDVLLALWDAFKEHGIQIPYPHREVFVHEKKEA
ncbi:MAG: mechanosensitive ion channel family protein [Micavibrio aeruginosavorus]|uniref:Mechanosensitive ion channel family protein n=1 Tax=Micavibrio aeruginosavorus TaxID=349221 RepID=A0A2W5N6L3_9BACT|nr:MAG: mechanosensitive ion channel family protein [Micavibrio aeruginosavorus]